MPLAAGAPRRPMMRKMGMDSVDPTPAPSSVAVRRCSSVAPACSARVRASPAPAPIPVATAPAIPKGPNAPMARKGYTELKDSPNLRPTLSSYPGAAVNGARAAWANSRAFAATTFSVSVGSSAEAPIAVLSAKLTTPGIWPFINSLICPPKVVSGLAADRCVTISAGVYPALSAAPVSNFCCLPRNSAIS